MLSLLLILFQTSTSYAKTDDSSEVVSSEETDSSTSQENAEPATDEQISESSENNKDKKSKDEAPESAIPESTIMSMTSGGASALSGGGVYSNPEAVTVSQTGAASFSYPIAVPPGRNGLQPNISLQYNSYGDNGWIGVGWDLDLGSIHRSRRNGLNYSTNNFMVNGSDLVSRTDWGSNYYGAKIEGAFTKYYFNTGSNYWIAYAKDGTKYYYGQTAASRMANGSNTYSWHLNKVEDTNGNYMTITYTTNLNQLYPSQISYTGKTGGLSPNKIVEFELEDRDDDIYSYKTKYLVTTAKRLKTVTVKVDGASAYKYILEYDSGQNGRSRLTRIKRVDPNNANNFLPPTDFSFIDGGDGTFGTPSSTSLGGSTGGKLVFGDINGDGRTDFVKAYAPTGTNPTVTVYPYLANSSGTGFTAQTAKTLEKCPTGSMSVALGDINGDGKADIVSNGLNGQVHAYLSLGNGLFSGKYTTTGASGITSIYLAELNGDGKADLVKLNTSMAYVYSYLSNGNGSFGTQNFISLTEYTLYDTPKILLGDVNGDGLADLYYYTYFFVPPEEYYVTICMVGIYLGNGSGGFGNDYFCDVPDSWVYGREVLTDVNGDGLADLIGFTSTTNMQVYISNGAGMQSPVNSTVTNPYIYTADIDDDGMDDIIHSGNYFRKSKGDGTFAPAISAGGPTGSYTIYLADIDGDGRPDMIKHNSTGNSISYSTANGGDAADQIDTIINPLGGQTDINYANPTDIPNSKIPFAIHPVAEILAYDGILDDGINDMPAVTSYEYSGAYYDYTERDFREFEYVIQNTSCGKTVKTIYEQYDAYQKGRPLTIETSIQGGSEPYMVTTFTWATVPLGSTAAKFVKLTNKRVDIDDNGATEHTNEAYTSYDNTHGGLLTMVKSGSGGAENVTITNTYINKGTWIWRVASESITGSSTGLARQTTYAYDSRGNLGTKTYVNTTGSNIIENYTYDPIYGNLATYTDNKNNTTQYFYDSATYTHVTGIQYPTTEVGTRNVPHSVSMVYDKDITGSTKFGQIAQETDDNGKTTHYYYDAYGRPIQINYPDGGQLKYEYSDIYNPLNPAYPIYVKISVLELTGVYVDTYEYVDGYGRGIMNVSEGKNTGGNNFVVTRQYYDEAGRNWKTEGPYFSSSYAFSYAVPPLCPTIEREFDCMGRVVEIKTPHFQGSIQQFDTANINYSGFETEIIDADGNTRTEITDYLGRLIQVQEDTGGGTTYYAYNAAGDLKTVTDAASNTTTITYNTLGQKKTMVDPDMGTWSYSYDLNGNLQTQTDNKGNIITFGYDELNRVLSKNYTIYSWPVTDPRYAQPTPNVAYAYDNLTPGSNGKGRLYSVSNGDVQTTYNGYDAMGRVLSVSKTISGDIARTTHYTYDLSGKLKTTTYPDAPDYLVITNSYHPHTNLLDTVTGSDGKNYASISSYTPSGKIKTLSHGNGSSTTYTYDSRTEKLNQIETKNINLQTIQKRVYGYTVIGEISSINDQNNITYSYTYDDLSRLTNETNDGPYGAITTEYYPIGNIESKTIGGATFSYSYNSAKKHAVSSVTNTGSSQTYNYEYDNNGNMKTGWDFTNPADIKSRHILYNADNMPGSIEIKRGVTTVSTSSFLYDGMGARAKKSVGATHTYYIGDHFEIENGTYVRYIFAGNLRVAQVKGGVRSYFHKDHLGSSTVMTNDDGIEIQNSYTDYMPFGEKRNSSAIPADYLFTDQELDAESGLYNYNARLYDPNIGRFISPDSIVPEPFNPQSLNRYTYCLNNPLIYVDPSGHVCGPNDPQCDEYMLKEIVVHGYRQMSPEEIQSWMNMPIIPPIPPGAFIGSPDIGGGEKPPKETPKDPQKDCSKKDKEKDNPKCNQSYFNCFSKCVEKERFDLFGLLDDTAEWLQLGEVELFGAVTLARDLAIGWMPKTATEKGKHFMGRYGNLSKYWDQTGQMSRWAGRFNIPGLRHFGRTAFGSILGGVATGALLFEGFYDIGAIGRCELVCLLNKCAY